MAKNLENFKEINFFAFDRLSDDDLINPSPAIKNLPEWYRSAKKFDKEDIPTFKACASFLDALAAGYNFLFPCDINIDVIDNNLNITIDERYKHLFQMRAPMDNLATPYGCYDNHFAFIPQWGVQLPEGYSALYIHPLNMFDLPFVVTNGIIENDKIINPGAIPFFIRSDFRGTIKKGTPFVQVIPFKRDNWNSNILLEDKDKMMEISNENSKKFRSIKSGYYKNNFWQPKIFK
jgi:hypothetical protein